MMSLEFFYDLFKQIWRKKILAPQTGSAKNAQISGPSDVLAINNKEMMLKKGAFGLIDKFSDVTHVKLPLASTYR